LFRLPLSAFSPKKMVGKMPREFQIGVLLLMPFCLFANEQDDEAIAFYRLVSIALLPSVATRSPQLRRQHSLNAFHDIKSVYQVVDVIQFVRFENQHFAHPV